MIQRVCEAILLTLLGIGVLGLFFMLGHTIWEWYTFYRKV